MNELSTTESEAMEFMNQTSGITNPEQWLVDYMGGGSSASGQLVTPYRALGLPAVWASVQLIAGQLATMPLQIRRPTSRGSEDMPMHPAAKLLEQSTNDLQTPHIFKETLMTHALLQGNGRALIRRNAISQPVELIIINPENCETRMVRGQKVHQFHFDPDYYEPGGWVQLPDSQVFHIPGLGQDGIRGYSLVQALKETFGTDLSGRDSAAYSFRNNGRPGLLLEAPRGVFRTEKEAQEFLNAFNKSHKGDKNSSKTGLLREGMKAHTLPLSAQDAQFIEQRKFSREDIAYVFGTAGMLGEGKAVYKDLSERQTAFITNTLSKWFSKWYDEISRKLLSERDRATGVCAHFDTTAFVRGDPNTLADYTAKMRTQGALSANEVRELHGFDRVPGLDDYDNPNIAKANEAEPSEEETEDSPEQTEPEDRYRHIDRLIASEKRKIIQAAKGKGNFVSWSEQFYRKHLPKLENVCEASGIPTYQAGEYCDRSIDLILEVVGVVPEDQLSTALSQVVDNWETRRSEFDA